MSNREAQALRCAGVQRFVDTYLDGEFAESDRAEFDAHVAECERCRLRVKRQADWKAAIKQAGPHEAAPAALRNRVKRAIAVEGAPKLTWRRWAVRVTPLAAMGGLLATLFASKVPFSPVATSIIETHRRNLPVEFAGAPDQMKRWYQDKVDFPVRLPQLGRAALRGGRLANVRDRQAAYLQYEVNGSKVSVFIFDPGKLQLEARRKQVIGNREVYLDEEGGYNVAIFRDHGMGYAIASDLDPEQMIKMVGAAVQP